MQPFAYLHNTYSLVHQQYKWPVALQRCSRLLEFCQIFSNYQSLDRLSTTCCLLSMHARLQEEACIAYAPNAPHHLHQPTDVPHRLQVASYSRQGIWGEHMQVRCRRVGSGVSLMYRLVYTNAAQSACYAAGLSLDLRGFIQHFLYQLLTRQQLVHSCFGRAEHPRRVHQRITRLQSSSEQGPTGQIVRGHQRSFTHRQNSF